MKRPDEVSHHQVEPDHHRPKETIMATRTDTRRAPRALSALITAAVIGLAPIFVAMAIAASQVAK